MTWRTRESTEQGLRPHTTGRPPSPLAALLAEYRQQEPIYVTRPSMPPLRDYARSLEAIWQRRWLTNDGPAHQALEGELRAFLGVEHLSLFCNGATALLVALQALGVEQGEVITTPFTFPATAHVLHWNGLTPVFCDIEPRTFNIDVDKVERLIGPRTRAILAVHVYGNPCALEALQGLAQRHNLRLIYDAAHAFGVQVGGKSLLNFGDLAMLSFHATKVFSTIEGGALVSRSPQMRQRINSLKNFGIAGEEEVIGPGINGKMNEFQAAYGLLQLQTVQEQIARRRVIAQTYREALKEVPGIRFLRDLPNIRHNYGYFPIIISKRTYGMDRNALAEALKPFNIFPRKYFYPLVSQAPCYAALPSARRGNLPVAERIARSVLCLPIYSDLSPRTAADIAKVIAALPRTERQSVE